MARYHPVRPKPKHQQVPTPAAPAQPQPQPDKRLTPAQREALQKRMQSAAETMYKDRGGDEVDASIERCKKLLAIHDRELETLANHDFSQPHRWTISPSIAYRFDKLMHDLMAKREQMQIECMAMVQHAVGEIARDEVADSLCPSKSPDPASEAASKPDTDRQPPKEPADADHIAA